MGYFEELIGVNLWTALFTLLNTIVVIVVGTKFLFKPVMKMIQSRQQEIDDMYAQADAAKANANAMETEYKNRLAAAQETGDTLVKEAMARGKNREEEIIRQANREADAIREKAVQDAAREKKKALNDAKDEISSIALEIAGKVIGESMDDEKQQRIVDNFLAELGEQA